MREPRVWLQCAGVGLERWRRGPDVGRYRARARDGGVSGRAPLQLGVGGAAVRRRDRRSRGARVGGGYRHGVGGRPLRARDDRSPPVDARESSRALHRRLRATGGRDRRRPDVDPRLPPRQRPARPRPCDDGGAWRGGGIMRFHPRLPNDTATLLLLVVFIIAILATSGSLPIPPPTTPSRSRRSVPS